MALLRAGRTLSLSKREGWVVELLIVELLIVVVWALELVYVQFAGVVQSVLQ